MKKLNSDEVMIESEQNSKERDYWLSKLEGDLKKSIIPYDQKRNNQSFKTENFTIEDKLYVRMMQICKNYDLKLYMLLVSGIIILVNKLTNSNDIIIGGPILKQNVEGTFVNTVLAFRNQINEDMNFKDILALCKHTIIEAFENANYPIERLIYQLGLENIKDNFPLFDICVVLNNIQKKEYISEIPVNLKISFNRDDKCIQGQINYNSNLYKDTTIQRFIKHLNIIFEIIIFNPDKKIKYIGLTTDKEKEEILFHFNNTAVDYPMNQSIKDLIEEQVTKIPNHTAIIFEDQKLTYRELNNKANKLSSILIQKGMKRNDYIPIMIDHSLELIISILAVMKMGAAFVPIDVNWPKQRTKAILTDLNCKIVLTAQDTDVLQAETTDQYSFLKVKASDLEGLERNPNVKIDQEDLIYIIYTSGSTGKPKGVMVPHRGVLNRFLWMNDYFGKVSAKSVLQTTRYVYDSAVWQIYWPLMNGGQVVILPPSYALTAENLSALIEKHQVTLTDFVPSVFNTIVNQISDTEEQKEKFKSLRNIILGGEEVTARTTHEFLKKYPKINIINLYGPTEVSIGSVYHQIKGDEGEQIPIGKPIANLEVYILDKNINLMPTGISGEICLGGKGVGLGYLNNKEKSNQAFVDNPFRPGEKMYRTGDLARWDDVGRIYFLGRIDFQIKIRGFRIEIGEIENKILDSGLIEQCLVVAKNDADSNKNLCSYIVRKNLESSSSQEKERYNRHFPLYAKVHKQKRDIDDVKEDDILILLKSYLKQQLPEYMIPTYFIELDQIPLTAGGKIDRKALPEPEMRIVGTYTPPLTIMEKHIVEMWAEELNIEKDLIGIDSNFFDLGGHSLKVINLISKIQKKFTIRISLPDMFKLPTIRGISNYIKNSVKEDYVSIEQTKANEHYPLSASQRKLFSAQEIQKDSTSYNIQGAATLIGVLNIKRIEEVIYHLVQRHESLRTSFEMVDNQPVQKVHMNVHFNIEYYQVTEDQVLDTLKEKFIRPFDLSVAPLLRVGIAKINQEKHILTLDIHHIIADAISIQVILRDFMGLYENSDLPELKIQYKDYAVWENSREVQKIIKKQDNYWMNMYQKEPRPLDMPIDFTRGSGVQSFAGDEIDLKIDAEITMTIKQAVSENKVTLYSYLLTAYCILLSKYTNNEDIVVGTPASGRTQADLENIVGMFVNVLPIRNYIDSRKTFIDLLGQVHENLLNALNNQNFNMDKIVKNLNIRKTLNRNLLFDTTFVLQNMDHTEIEIEDLILETYSLKSTSAKFEIVITLVEKEDYLTLRAEYSTGLYTEKTIERFCQHYIDILGSVVKDKNIKVYDINLLDTSSEDIELSEDSLGEELQFDF